jgi:hypothetical protein
MTQIRCEEFERDFAYQSDSQTDPARQQALENHRQNCSFCRSYSTITFNLRAALSCVPKLETTPQFIFNLRREINRLERPRTNREIGVAPLPHTLAVSTGFALAVVMGIFLLRPGQPIQEIVPINSNPPVIATQTTATQAVPKTVTKPERVEPQITVPTSRDLLASGTLGRDTLKHRLPEAPGKDSIPIPVENDLWRMNQVSTTPGGP